MPNLKILRLLLSVLIFNIPLIVFSQNNSDQFILNGHLSNLKDSMRKIYISYRVEGKEVYDSSIVKKDSYFFKGKIDEPTLAVLQPQYIKSIDSRYKSTDYMGQAIAIFLEPKQMEIYNSVLYDSFIVKGSNSDITYQKLIKQADPFYLKLKSLGKRYDSLNAGKEKEKIVDMRIKIYQQMKDSVFYKYLVSTPSTPIAIYLLDFYFSDSLDLTKAKPLFKKISREAQLSRSGQIFKRRIEYATYLENREQAIDFSQKDELGNIRNLRSFRGSYVLLDFWASWCYPCRMQNPGLIQTYNQFKKNAFKIISISLDIDKGNWKKAILNDSMNWINLSDLKGPENSVALKYNVQSIPQNFLIDAKGKIIGKNIWGRELDQLLKNIFKE